LLGLGLGQIEHLARHDNISDQVIYPAKGIDIHTKAKGYFP
jgi:hypothetical protein